LKDFEHFARNFKEVIFKLFASLLPIPRLQSLKGVVQNTIINHHVPIQVCIKSTNSSAHLGIFPFSNLVHVGIQGVMWNWYCSKTRQ
jgi:hypothetical protein